MAKHPHTNRPAILMEGLESRQLLSWNWNAQMIHQDQAAADFPGLTGAGETVVVVDTGAFSSHPSLVGGSGPWGKIVAWVDFVGSAANPLDNDGHGTGVSSILVGNGYTYSGDGSYGQGIAPGANLIVLRTDDARNKTPWATQAQRIANAMDWVIAHQAQYNIVAVNMSTGSTATFTDEALTGDPNLAIDQTLQQKFATLAAAGVFLGAAAGNDGGTARNSVEYPAADPNVYSISSINASFQTSSYASYGTLNDLLAPADNIILPYYFPKDPTLINTYYISGGVGTSFASPQMVGAAVLLKQIDPSFTPQQIIQILRDSGTTITDASTGNSFKLLNIDAAIELAINEADTMTNNAFASATPIPLSAGHGQLDNLTLLGGVADYYSFKLTGVSDVGLALNYGGGDYPDVQLYNVNGTSIGSIPAGGTTRQLAAGTYFIRVFSASHLAGAYGVSIDATPLQIPGANATVAKIAYDTSGNLHMAYYDAAGSALKYAVRSGGVWSTVTTIDSTPGAGTQISLAIDPNGLPGIAYYDSVNANLNYAHFNGSSWDIAVVDYYKIVGQNPSLIYTVDGSPVISYYQGTYGDLRIASASGNTWFSLTADSTGNVGRSSSLAYDPTSGQVAVAYEDSTNGWYKYAYYYRRGWRTSVVDSTTRAAGGSISLQIDPSHLPSMSYYDAYNQDLIYARNNGTRWSITRVASKYNQGLYTNLSFRNGGTEILYYSPSYGGIYRASSTGGLWSVTAIGTGGSFLDEATDAFGHRTISWIDASGVEALDI